MKKKPFQRPRALQPNPFPHQKIFGGPRKTKLFKRHSLTKNFWRSHEKKPFQRPRALQPNPFPHQKIFGGPRKTKLFKRHSLTKNFWRSQENKTLEKTQGFPAQSIPSPKISGLSSPIHSLTNPFPCNFCLTLFLCGVKIEDSSSFCS